MKTMMKKTAAYLLALLLVIQMVPAFADTVYGEYTQSNVTYRDAIEITSKNNFDILKVGMTDELTVQSSYKDVSWSSDHPEVATVDASGLVEAVGAGKVTITVVSEGLYKDTISFKVVGETKAEEPETEPAAPTGEAGDDQGEEQSRDEKLIIFIKGSKTKVEYNGQLQKNEYTVSTSNDELFDEDKLTMTADHRAEQKDCGVWQDNMSEADFTYDGNAEIVVSNGWIQIKPKAVTVKADDKKILGGRGEEPVYTASIVEDLGEAEAPDLSGITFQLIGDQIAPEIEKGAIIGNYKMNAPLAGKLTVIEPQPLYNIVKISGKYYRLKKTQIWTEKDPVTDKNATLAGADYVVDAYDFSDLTITIDNKEYVYNGKKNAEAIALGANYYDIKGGTVSIVKNKIGAMTNGKPNWLIPEADQYPDKNETDSIHRDYEAVLHVNTEAVVEQEAYNFLSVDGSANYYKLPTTTIKAQLLDNLPKGKLEEGQYVLERYDFSKTVLNIDGIEYKYNDGSLDEYENYYTVSFEDVQKNDKFNRNDTWFKNKDSWLDGAYELFGSLPNNTVKFHANYAATTHKAEKRPISVKIISSLAGKKEVYAGTKVTLTAVPSGFDGVEYTIEWKCIKQDGTTYTISDANTLVYEYYIDAENAKNTYQVILTTVE